MKQTADKHGRPAPEFKPCDEVLLRAKYFKLPDTQSRKLSPRVVGPFEIVHSVGTHKLAYKLKLPQVVARMHPVFHVSALRPYLRSGAY